MDTATKRMMSDIKIMKKSNLENVRMYVHEDNMFCVDLMFFTDIKPYKYGIYFVRLNFDKKDHPFVPPKAIFFSCTHDVRFHPNLYENGKVCLSILNTWDGPKWSACQTLKSIAISILILFDEYPLFNEPQFQNNKKDDKTIQNYNNFIELANLSNTVHTLQMMSGLESDSGHPIVFFKNELSEYWNKNKNNIFEKVRSQESKSLSFPVYRSQIVFNKDKLLRSLEEL